MAEFATRLERARAHLGRSSWDEGRVARNEAGIKTRLRRRARARAAGAVALALLPLLALGALAARAVRRPGAGSTAVAAASTLGGDRVLRLEGGATTVALGPGAAVDPVEASGARTVLRLARGRAEFRVGHREGRTFRVEAGDVAVQVLGTEFAVERVGAGARVAVRSGRVRVFFGERFADLGAGDAGLFPSDGAAAVAAGAAPTAESGEGGGAGEHGAAAGAEAAGGAGVSSARVATAHEDEPARREVASGPGAGAGAGAWRSLAARGQYDEAWAALSHAGVSSVRDEVGELFAASDVARLSGHAAQAVGPLNRVLANHRGDPRAPLAAFTLGRVLLDDLGQAREAARAFAQVRGMGRAGALAEDALAREVEAWSRAGETERARAAASAYLERYPEGRAARRVRRWGGLP